MEIVVGTGLVTGFYSMYYYYTSTLHETVDTKKPLLEEVKKFDRLQMKHIDPDQLVKHERYKTELEEALLKKFKSVEDKIKHE